MELMVNEGPGVTKSLVTRILLKAFSDSLDSSYLEFRTVDKVQKT
jgi:hypothetical protein